MQHVIVRFPEARSVFSSGLLIGPTGERLRIEDGRHVFSLSDPQDYAPLSQELVVAGTSAAIPMIVTFVRISALLRRWFPVDLDDLTTLTPTVDAVLAHFAPLGLAWEINRADAFGQVRARAVLSLDAATGEVWTIAAMEAAKADKHRHNAGGDYGEMIVTLAGELVDTDDREQPITLGANCVHFHGAGTTHQARADRFWLGLFHQPRGITPVE